MADEASEWKDDIERIKDVLGDDGQDGDEDYDSEESDSQLFIDLGISTATKSTCSKEKESTAYVDASSVSALSQYDRLSVSLLDEDSRSQMGSVHEEPDENIMAELPINVETCLALNRAYQEIVSDFIENVQRTLNENRERQQLLESEMASGVKTHEQKSTANRPQRGFSIPFFKDNSGMPLPPNEDVKTKKMLNERKQEPVNALGWSARAQRLLMSAVGKDCLRRLLQPLMNRREFYEGKKSRDISPEEEADLDKKIEELDEEINEKKKTKEEVLLKDVDDEKVDWMRIAKIEFDGKREWYELQKIWKTVVNPAINKQEWTEEETAKLLNLVDKYKTGQWDKIVEELGTNRTPFQALQYYQANISYGVRQRPWTKEEEEKLVEAIEQVNVTEPNCTSDKRKWQLVSFIMEERSSDQCRKRWLQIDPDIKRTKWTADEDVRLMLAVKLIGSKDWQKVANYVPHRHGAQCRERYLNYLDPKLRVGCRFTYAEDKKILKLVKEHGVGNWSKIASFLDGRTDQMVSSRYRRLMQWKYSQDWFLRQSEEVQRVLKGLPLYKKKNNKNEKPQVDWNAYLSNYGLLPEHYEEQRKDIDKNADIIVPYPPLMKATLKGAQMKVKEKYRERVALSNHIDSLLEKDYLSTEEMDKRKQAILRRLEEKNESLYSASVQKLIKEAKEAARLLCKGRMKRNRDRMNAFLEVQRLVLGSNIKPRLTSGRPAKYFGDEEPISEEEQKKLSVSVLSMVVKALSITGKEILDNVKKSDLPLTMTQQKDVAILQEVVYKDRSYTGTTVGNQNEESSKGKRKSAYRQAPQQVNPTKKSKKGHASKTPENEIHDAELEKEQDSTESTDCPNTVNTPETPLRNDKCSSNGLNSEKTQCTKSGKIQSTTDCPNTVNNPATPLRNDKCSSNDLNSEKTQSTNPKQTQSTNASQASPSPFPATPSTSGSGSSPSVFLSPRTESQGVPKQVPKDGLPFLPPSLSSLKGFKSLLLKRRKMIKRAGGSYLMLQNILKSKKTRVKSATKQTQVNPNCQYVYVYPKVTPGVTVVNPQPASSQTQSKSSETTSLVSDTESRVSQIEYKKKRVPISLRKTVTKASVEMMNQKARKDHAAADLESESSRTISSVASSSEEEVASATVNTEVIVVSSDEATTSANNNTSATNGTGNTNENSNPDDQNSATMDTSVSTENQQEPTMSPEEQKFCEIRESADYKLLKARFEAIFMWPAVLSQFNVNDIKQDKNNPTEADSEASTTTVEKPKKKRKYALTKSRRYYKYVTKKRSEKERILGQKNKTLQSNKNKSLQNTGQESESVETNADSQDGASTSQTCESGKGSENQTENQDTMDSEDAPPKKRKVGRPKGSKTKIPEVENIRHSSRNTDRKNYMEPSLNLSTHVPRTTQPTDRMKQKHYEKAVSDLLQAAKGELVGNLRFKFGQESTKGSRQSLYEYEREIKEEDYVE